MLKANENNTAPLQEGTSLQVFADSELVFENKGKWLYPLFELEVFIKNRKLRADRLLLHDRIAGRAAAALITRMGFKKCIIDIVSSPGLEIFRKHGIKCSYNRIVDLIQCRTEHIVTDKMTLDDIYYMLKKRAGLIHGVDLNINGLYASYDGRPVINNLNLSLKSGDSIVITGDNGAGKTTLLKTIAGIIPIAKGRITVSGNRVGNLKKRDFSIGYVNQLNAVSPFPISSEEIVSSGLAGRKIKGSDIKYSVEISMRRTGCFHLYGRNFFTLSGGEKQKVSLARCLCHKAGLLLLDEPTSFLDGDSKTELLTVLDNIKNTNAPTILIVSHDHEWIKKLKWPVKKLKGGILC
ncbi:MAG: DUF1893 domain-containing protein [Spirochaetes bacterium]|nr:DUF1893 domain-containing protein [Spirochaetota bacterium]